MKRREVATLIGGALAWPWVARAQPAKRIPRVGLFCPPPRNAEIEAFLAGLRDLGWVEGETVHVEYRDAGGNDALLPALAAELVALDIDVLVTSTTPGVLAAQRATTTIPTVMLSGGDLVAMGLAQSLAHPGGNITGLTFFRDELTAKRLEILVSMAPTMRQVGVLVIRGYPMNAGTISALTAAAETLKVTVRAIEIDGLGDIDSALAAAGPIDGLIISDTNLLITNPSIVAASVEKHRLASIATPAIASHGALLGYGVDFTDMFHRGAAIVDKILKGARAGDIPIQQPTTFKTVVNLKTAKAIGVEIPPLVLVRADEVIE